MKGKKVDIHFVYPPWPSVAHATCDTSARDITRGNRSWCFALVMSKTWGLMFCPMYDMMTVDGCIHLVYTASKLSWILPLLLMSVDMHACLCAVLFFACMRCDGIVNNIVTMLTLQSRDWYKLRVWCPCIQLHPYTQWYERRKERRRTNETTCSAMRHAGIERIHIYISTEFQSIEIYTMKIEGRDGMVKWNQECLVYICVVCVCEIWEASIDIQNIRMNNEWKGRKLISPSFIRHGLLLCMRLATHRHGI